MRKYFSIGPVPANENFPKENSPNYHSIARQNCDRFVKLIRNVVGVEPDETELVVRSFDSKFGTYYDVGCFFDNEIPESVEYIDDIQLLVPDTWDEE